jgi:hypothetical protein
MNTTKRKNPTKAQATKVLNALKRQRAAYIDGPDSGPKLVENWDWLGNGSDYIARWSIVWEEGPYEWSYLFPFGGIDEEFGFHVANVSDAIPEGFYSEAITSWAIGLYEG